MKEVTASFPRGSARATILQVVQITPEVLAGMLRAHGEHELAERTASFTDDELQRIGTLGAFYAWSEDAFALGFGMGGTRAFALASIDVLEESGRDLHRDHTEQEVAVGFSETPDADERERELVLRRRAAEKHLHGRTGPAGPLR